MMDIAPHQPHRPLFWPDIVLDVQAFLADTPDEIYIVGGAVRDALLHRPLHDIDFATSGHGIQIARKIANYFKGDFFALDNERDVGRVILDTPDGKLMLDVARYRGISLIDDLTGRDFTLNAMAVDVKGDLNLLVDPLHGEDDIKNHLLRRCSDHALSDDPIRVLRAVRQSSQLNMHIEASTLRDIKTSVNLMRDSSPERIRDEWFKLLSVPRPVAALRIADSLGIVQQVIPEVAPLHHLQITSPFKQDYWTHTLAFVENLTNIINVVGYTRTDQTAASFGLGMLAIQLDRFRSQLITHISTLWPNDRTHSALLIVAALLYDSGRAEGGENDEAKTAANADIRSDDLRLSAAEKVRLVTIMRSQNRVIDLADTSPLSIYQFWRKLNEAGVDICLLTLANYLATQGAYLKQNDWLVLVDRVRILLDAWYNQREQFVAPPALVDGNVLMQQFQLKPGPILGELLEQIRVAQVTGEVRTQADALAFVAAYLRDKT